MSRGNQGSVSRSGKDSFRLGNWLVQPELNRLQKGGHETGLQPRLMRLLVYLAERRGEVVRKEDIVDRVWNGRTVTDESLAKAISQLRKALGDDRDTPRYIETVRKSGYRVVASVEAAASPHSKRRRHGTVALAASVTAALAVAYWATRPSPPLAAALNAMPVTSRPGRERDPDVSGDGANLVYSASAPDGSEQIFLHGIGRGAGDRQITRRGDNRAPVFFPDDSRIAYLRRDGSRCAVMMTTLIDGAERVVGDCDGNGYSDTDISQDGRLIAFNARENDEESRAIYVLQVDNGVRHAVTAPPPGIWGDYDPQFTEDGKAIVFARSVSESLQDVHVVELDTRKERRLTAEGRNVMGVAVRRDRIIYGSNRNGRYALWSLGLDGTRLQRLPITSAGILNPNVSADGGTLVFEEIDRSVTLERIGLGGDAPPVPVLTFNADVLHPSVSPTNGRIAFSTNRSGFYEIWDADESGGDLRQLTRFFGGFTAHPQYSPDGERVAFDARPRANARIYIMYSDGSRSVAITDAARNAYAPTWSADGRTVYYGMETDDALQIWSTDTDTGESQQITHGGGFFGRIANDGRLYYVRPGADGIWRLRPGHSAPPERITEAPVFADWGNWTLRGDRVLFYDRARQSLRAYSIDTGVLETITRVDGNVPPADPTFALGRDGTSALLGDLIRYDSDVEMVRFEGADSGLHAR